MGLCYNIAFVFLFDKIYPEECSIIGTFQILNKEEKENTNKYIIKVLNISEIKYSKNTKLILYEKENFIPGDIIKTSGNFEKGDTSRNYKGFNYRKYLKTKKIYGIIYSDKSIFICNKININTLIEQLRLNFSNKIDELYNKNYNDFLKGILVGNSNNIDEKIKNNFQNSNISHILAISGLHISYVILGLNFILNKIIKNKKVRNYFIIIFLILFIFFTGFSPSCIRAVIMSSMIILAFNFNRKSNFYLNFITAFFIIILINPFFIHSVGMWLSFMGTLGIVVFHKVLFKICKFKLRKMKYKKLHLKIINIILLSVSAQILILPIMIYNFNTFSLTFMISNFFISFFIPLILCLGYISVFISFLNFPFIKIIIYIEEFLIFIVFKIAEICSNLPFSKIYIITPNILCFFIYYFFILLIIYLFKRRKKLFFKIILLKNVKKIFFKYFKKYFKILIIISLIIFINPINKNLEIYFVDVGQGDCTVIYTPSGKNIIIDGGEGNTDKYDYGEKVVLPYLLDRKIRKIDYMIISHADSDHIGGCFAILENLKVEKIILGLQSKESDQLKDLIKIAKEKKIEIKVVKSGDKLKIEKEVYIDILWPIEGEMVQENPLNNNSLVCKLIYKNFSMLFTGDIEKESEEKIVQFYKNTNKLNSNILKIAHHGSKTSSSPTFIEKVKPQIALIGVSKNNKFGHPNNGVIERLKSRNIKIYRTDKNGEIDIKVDKNGKYNILSIIF